MSVAVNLLVALGYWFALGILMAWRVRDLVEGGGEADRDEEAIR